MKKTLVGLCTGPVLIGHRGASREFPENTLPAFARALELGASMLELDVRLSKDKQVVVIHDPSVNRTTDGSGLVKNLTLAELKVLNPKIPDNGRAAANAAKAGKIRIATLEEVFLAFPRAIIAVEIKDKNWELCSRVVDLIRRFQRFDITTVELIRVNSKLAEALREYEPRLTTGHTTGEIIRFMTLSRLRASRLFKPKGAVFEVPLRKGKIRVVTRAFVRDAHKKGVRVFVWTVNDGNTMSRLFKMGVDGIFTDDLELAKTVTEHLRLLGK